MTNQAGRARLQQDFNVSRETLMKLDKYVSLVTTAAASQNLVAQSTIPDLWDRHILDSAQLLRHTGPTGGSWLDVGSGAGFPALVIACMHDVNYVCIEPRRLRADFLKMAVSELGLETRVSVVRKRVEAYRQAAASVITARAFASLIQTVRATLHLGDERTIWLLHKGRNAASEAAEAMAAVPADYELLPSITASDASIVRVSDIVGLRP